MYVFICYAIGIAKTLSHMNSSNMDERQQDVKNFVKIRRQFKAVQKMAKGE